MRALNFRGLPGFAGSAHSFNMKGDISFTQAAISYQALDYFFKAEWARMRSDTFTVQSYDGYDLSGGYTLCDCGA